MSHTVGVIGLGYGRAHIPAFQVHGCRVVAVSQRDGAAGRAVADRYGIPDVYERWQDLIDRARPEIVVIATPPHLHRAIALHAFAAGAHVLCEKPLAMTAAEAQDMATAARAAGRVAMTSFNWRFTAAFQELDARVRAGAIGRVFHVGGRWINGRWAEERTAGTWRMDRRQAGHGAMGDQGVHLVDMVRSLFGDFVRVTSQSGLAFPARGAPGTGAPADAEDHVSVLAELDGGVQATLSANRAAHGMSESTLEIYGTHGSLHYRSGRDGARWWEGELRISEDNARPRPVALSATPPASAGEGDLSDVIGKTTIAGVVGRMLEGIRTGRTPSPSFDDGVAAQAVLDAALQAASSHTWVNVQARG